MIVLYGVAGQLLRHVAPEHVTAATYSIEDLTKAQGNADRVLAAGAADVPAYTLTLDAPAGASSADATIIPVATTAGPSIGEAVVVVAADGRFEPVTLEAVALDDYLRARSLLAWNYEAGDTVRSATMTAAVPAALYNFEAALDDQRPLRVLWQYSTTAGEVRVSELLELTRGNAATASLGPAIERLQDGYPELAPRLLEGLTIQALARVAHRRIVAEFATRGVTAQQILLGDPGVELLVSKMLAEAAQRGYAPGIRDIGQFVVDTRRDYEQQLAALVTGTRGSQAAALDTEDVSVDRADPTYITPIRAL